MGSDGPPVERSVAPAVVPDARLRHVRERVLRGVSAFFVVEVCEGLRHLQTTRRKEKRFLKINEIISSNTLNMNTNMYFIFIFL